MKALIFLGGEDYEGDLKIAKDDIIICCDRAYDYLSKREIKPDVILGDFDSLGFIPEGATVFPVEKDMTDYEIAVDYLIKHSIVNAEVYCGGGGRDDHLLANFAVTGKAFKSGVNLKFITNYSTSFFIKGSVVFPIESGAVVSVIAFDKIKIKSSEGLKYAYKDTVLNFYTSLGISNVATSNKVKIDIEDGEALVLLVTAELKQKKEG